MDGHGPPPRTDVLPLADVLTPNQFEAEVLTGPSPPILHAPASVLSTRRSHLDGSLPAPPFHRWTQGSRSRRRATRSVPASTCTRTAPARSSSPAPCSSGAGPGTGTRGRAGRSTCTSSAAPVRCVAWRGVAWRPAGFMSCNGTSIVGLSFTFIHLTVFWARSRTKQVVESPGHVPHRRAPPAGLLHR